jgi:hypothetical protein
VLKGSSYKPYIYAEVSSKTPNVQSGNYKKDFSSQIDAIEANHSTDYDPKKSFTKTQGRFPNVKTSKKDDSRSNNKKPFDTSNKNR